MSGRHAHASHDWAVLYLAVAVFLVGSVGLLVYLVVAGDDLESGACCG